MAINKFVLSTMIDAIIAAMNNGESFEMKYVNIADTEIAKKRTGDDPAIEGFNLTLIDPVKAYEDGFFDEIDNDDDNDDDQSISRTTKTTSGAIDSIFDSDTLYPQMVDSIKDLKDCIAKIDAMADAYHLKVSVNNLINSLSATEDDKHE